MNKSRIQPDYSWNRKCNIDLLVQISLVFLVLFCVPDTVCGDVRWDASLLSEYPAAKRPPDTPIILHFTRKDCGGCNLMRTRAFRDRDVIAHMTPYVKILIDADTPDGLKEAEQFRISKYPATILLDPDGKEITRRLGMLPAREFVKWLVEGIQGKKVLTFYLNYLKDNPDSLLVNLAVARIYRDRMEVKAASEYYRRVRELDPRNENHVNAVAIFELASMFRESSRYQNAVILYRIFLKKYPRHRLVEIVYLDLIAVYRDTNRRETALDMFKIYRNTFKEYYRAHFRFARFCIDEGIQHEEALHAATHAVQLAGNNIDNLQLLAEAYAFNGRCVQAKDTIEKALAIEPLSEILQSLRKKYENKRCQ